MGQLRRDDCGRDQRGCQRGRAFRAAPGGGDLAFQATRAQTEEWQAWLGEAGQCPAGRDRRRPAVKDVAGCDLGMPMWRSYLSMKPRKPQKPRKLQKIDRNC